MDRRYIWLYFILFIGLYLVFAFFSFHQITVADEVICLNAAEAINTEGIPRDLDGSYSLAFNHPPAYLYMVAFLGKFLGISNESARLVGIFCFLISLWLIYGISRELFKNERNSYLVALGACFLYCINSMVIQGSLILSAADTTVLTVALLLFILYFVKTPQLLSTKNLIFLGMLFALALWTKLTTPLVLIPSIILFYFFNRDYKRGLYYAAIISFVGGALFLVSWWLYCHLTGAPFFLPLRSLKDRFIYMALPGGLLHSVIMVIRTVWGVTLRASPFFMALAVMVIGGRIRLFRQKKILSKIDFLVIYSLLIFVVYLISGRLNYGFPLYYFPIISTLSILVSSLIFSNKIDFERKVWIILGFSIPLLIMYNIYLIGDLIYTSDYMVKESLITGSPALRSVLLEGIVKFLFYLLPLAVYFFGLRLLIRRYSLSSILIVSLLIMGISANLSLNILQAKADYLTRFNYGGRKTEEVIDFVNSHVDPSGLVLAPPEIIYYSNNNNPSYYYLRDVLQKLDEKELVKAISDKKVTCLVYGICSQMVSHFTDVINKPSVQEALNRGFKATKIGSYTVWLRNGIF